MDLSCKPRFDSAVSFRSLQAPATAGGEDKGGSGYSMLTRHNARFTVTSLEFDPLSGRHLLVAGLHEAQVWLASRFTTVRLLVHVELYYSVVCHSVLIPDRGYPQVAPRLL